MAQANVNVDNDASKLSYDRAAPELSDLKKGDFHYNIHAAGGGNEVAVMEMRRGGDVVRTHQSRPFPTGAFKLQESNSLLCCCCCRKSTDLNKASYVVKLKKSDPGLNMNDYF